MFSIHVCGRFYFDSFITAILDKILEDHLCVLSFHGTPHLQHKICPIKTVFALTRCCLPLAMFRSFHFPMQVSECPLCHHSALPGTI